MLRVSAFTLIALLNVALSVQVYADDSDTSDREAPPPDSGWIEEQIAPPTQAVEGWFAPFSQWVEQQIQKEPEQTFQPSIESGQTTPSADKLISPGKAGRIARKKVPGDLLRIQFHDLELPHYSVRLLSSKGEVVTLLIHAVSGALIHPESPAPDVEPDT